MDFGDKLKEEKENLKEFDVDLTEIVRAIEVEQESLDYKVMENEVVVDVDKFDNKNGYFDNKNGYSNIFDSGESLDYSSLFSYLENSVNENPYVNYGGDVEKIVNIGREQVDEKIMDYQEAEDYIFQSKIANLLNQDIKFIMNYKSQEKFETFKLFNKGFVEMAYNLV